MNKFLRIPLQLSAFAIFAVVIGYFSRSPAYQYASPQKATVKISLSHATDRVEPCIQLTPEEIAALPPNMRAELQCERARLPLVLEVGVNGELVLQVEALPSGLWNDGPASIYERFEMDPGMHHISVRLRDSARTDGWDYEHAQEVKLVPGRYLTITFRQELGGFEFR